ncbi:LPS assembly lipoprotein LptE [Luteimonas huabeiensis]|uniref:LPS-assembly lipoprotein LptE n=1 Tax=Luteimonas huabeiensis TaxID=1244513 RepID=UPI000464E2E1|nr:LPS assembly lipoprotein LptE [Luteimonas huabeiensis]
MRRLLPLVLLSTLLLGACGFHLRNALALPPDLGPVRVVAADPYSPLVDPVAMALARAGGEVVPATTADAATLELMSERWASTPIAIDEVGRAQEYSLRYAVVFRLRRADGSDLVPQQAIELSRDFVQESDGLVGTDSERELLAREMRREMVASILRRIDGASRQP